MPLDGILGYLVAVSLPIWLTVEEIIHRYGSNLHGASVIPLLAQPKPILEPGVGGL